MRPLILVTLLAFNLAAFSQRSFQDMTDAHRAKYLDKKFPEFAALKPDSALFSNADFAGKVVFINFWFENCVPCMKKTEGLNQLYARLKNDSNFIFVSFTFEDYQTIEKFRKQHQVDYNIYHLESSQCNTICCGYPTSFILDKNGITRYIYTGGSPTKEEATLQILTEIYPLIIKLVEK